MTSVRALGARTIAFVVAMLSATLTDCTVPIYALDGSVRGDACVPCGEAGCVSVLFDPDHCGACGRRCEEGPNAMRSCSQGLCRLVCRPGFGDCDGNPANGCETDVTTSAQNCGGCGNRCSADGGGLMCQDARCVSSCPPGRGDCNGTLDDGCETDTTTEIDNCGTCGTTCAGSANRRPECTDGACGQSCIETFADCDHNPANGCETSLNRSAMNCGACGNACTAAAGGLLCTGQPPSCRPGCLAGDTLCNGECVNFEVDPDHCGACDATACAVGGTRGTRNCVAGVCGVDCPVGWGNCDGNLANGCETNIAASTTHCGRCGNACPTTPNSVASCVAGICGSICSPGFGNCDGNLANGCETILATTVANCGTCGHSCAIANGTAGCAAGACTIAACNTGFADCANGVTDGCETNTTTTAARCGACTRTCTSANAVPACTASTCTIGMCNAGFADCDANAITGCEINTTNNVSHCGICGRACAFANAVPGCTASVCTIASCNSGFGNCDGSAANGCETPVTTTTNCGTCGHACVAGQVCSAGACVSACAVGLTLCAGACTVLATDPRNCGACGTVCTVANGTAGCASSACTVMACNGGFADCANGATDGCEINIGSNPANCGSCGHVCVLPNATEGCTGGTCVVASCTAGFGNCDGMSVNGCETATSSDVNNCGTCGHSCAVANGTGACSAGTCSIAQCDPGFVASGAVCIQAPPSRQLTPPSTSIVTTNTPRFTVLRAPGVPATHIEICSDPLCPSSSIVQTLLTGPGVDTIDATPLAAGSYFWRTHGASRGTAGPAVSALWQFRVPMNAGGGVNTFYGTELDWRRLRFATALVGAYGRNQVDLFRWNGTSMANSGSLAEPGGTTTWGSGVASAGDVNGDGLGDILIGNCPSGLATDDCNAVYLYRGNAGGGPTLLQTITAPAGAAGFGHGLSAAGDVNGDGYGDIIVGAFTSNTAYLWYGSAGAVPFTAAPNVTLSAAGACPSGCPPIVAGTSGQPWFGVSVSGAADFNGDRYADVIIGAPLGGWDRVFVYAGGPGGLTANPTSTLAPTFAMPKSFGLSVAEAGDTNNDGLSDLIVGGNTNGGVAQLYIGGSATPTNLNNPGASTDTFGIAVDGAGDTNGDGYGDLIVGAPGGSSAYIFRGNAGGAGSNASVTIRPPVSFVGRQVSGTGDFNNDGYFDVMVGACYPPAVGNCSNAVFFCLGGVGGINGNGCQRVNSSAGDLFGTYLQ